MTQQDERPMYPVADESLGSLFEGELEALAQVVSALPPDSVHAADLIGLDPAEYINPDSGVLDTGSYLAWRERVRQAQQAIALRLSGGKGEATGPGEGGPAQPPTARPRRGSREALKAAADASKRLQRREISPQDFLAQLKAGTSSH